MFMSTDTSLSCIDTRIFPTSIINIRIRAADSPGRRFWTGVHWRDMLHPLLASPGGRRERSRQMILKKTLIVGLLVIGIAAGAVLLFFAGDHDEGYPDAAASRGETSRVELQ